jgi:hypothetical protein
VTQAAGLWAQQKKDNLQTTLSLLNHPTQTTSYKSQFASLQPQNQGTTMIYQADVKTSLE